MHFTGSEASPNPIPVLNGATGIQCNTWAGSLGKHLKTGAKTPGIFSPKKVSPSFRSFFRCLGIQWTPSPTPMLPSGFYWKSRRCSIHGGYVCKKPNRVSGLGINFNKTLNGSEGTLTSPHYPDHYYNHLDFSVRIIGPDRTRLVVKFLKIDIEHQLECLYDYVELSSGGQIGDAVKFCGTHDTDMHRFNFVSEGNEAELRFHSDYSISGSGFSLTWHAVDVSACPLQTLTAKEGILTSPNYPDFLLAHLNCSVTILAPLGKRVWLEFHDYDVEKIPSQGDLLHPLSVKIS